MEKNSINEIGRRLKLSPRGIYKILKKLEKINTIKSEKIGNSIFYKINFEKEVGIKLAEFVLMQNEVNSYIKVQIEDLKGLKDIALSCVLFGSVLKVWKEAKDIDILFVLNKKNFDIFHRRIEEIKDFKPKKVHEILSTKYDLIKNIRNNDEVILDIIKTGNVLWGAEIIVEAIKYGTS